MTLESLPLNANGKVDRASLPRPEAASPSAHSAPRDAIERDLCAIFASVLRAERVGIDDNFFALGGDSILTIQVVARARKIGYALEVRDLFRGQTAAALATRLRSNRALALVDQGRAVGTLAPTPIRRWLATVMTAPDHFAQALLLDLERPVDPVALRQALAALVVHHDALRLRFPTDAGIFDDAATVPLEVHDRLTSAICGRLQASLSLADGPLVRCALAPDRLFLAIHHFLVDGVSWRILVEDLFSLLAGESLPRKTVSFQAWSERLLAKDAATHRPFWDAVPWNEAHVLPAPQSAHRSLERRSVSIDVDCTRSLLGRAPFRTTTEEVLLTALLRGLQSAFGGDMHAVHVEGHGRDGELDVSRTVGWFTVLYPVLLRAPLEASVDDALRAVKEEARLFASHGESFGLLDLYGVHRAQVSFNYLGQITSDFRLSNEDIGLSTDPNARAFHALDVSAIVREGGLEVSFTWDPVALEREAIARLAGRFEATLREIVGLEVDGLTPSDVVGASIGQGELDAVVAKATGSRGGAVDAFALSPLQRGFLFHHLERGGDDAYIPQLAVRLEAGFSIDALERAFRELVVRHDVLRTSIAWEGLSIPLQIVHREASPSFEQVTTDGSLTAWMEENRRRGFDLGRAPLTRGSIVRAEGATFFVWATHHVVEDGWSLPLLARELFALYANRVHGAPLALRPPAKYRDFVAWLAEKPSAPSHDFWRGALAGLDEATLLAPNLPPTEEWVRAERSLDGNAIQAAARRMRVTPSAMVHAALAIVIGRYTGRRDVLFGSTTSGRTAPLPDIETTIGPFINAVPVRTSWSNGSLAELVMRVHEHLQELREHEHLPLSEVLALGSLPRPAFDAFLTFENYPVDEALTTRLGELGIGSVRTFEKTHYPVSLIVTPGRELHMLLQYDERLSPSSPVTNALSHLANVLAAMVSDPDRRVSDVDLLDPEERHGLLATHRRAYAGPTRIDEFFALSAARSPQATAIVADGISVTYAEIDARSSALAAHLRGLGVGADSLVAVALPRRVELVVALLGVLRAGAAYVPLDLAYPDERIRFIVEDAKAAVIIADRGESSRFAGARLLHLDEIDDTRHVASVATSKEALAYLIYTSGSTGRPKGVAIAHRSAVDFIHWSLDTFSAADLRCVLAATSICFDLSIFELFVTLAAGGTIWLVENALAATADLPVTLVNTVPSAMATLIQTSAVPRTAKVVNLAGEPLGQALARAVGELGHVERLWNLYGPSEDTTYSTFAAVDPRADHPPRIGKPIANTDVYVLDDALSLVPRGAGGELVLHGEGLARGYLGRADLTADKFVPDPFAPEPGARMYRTGDRARWLPNGDLVLLGRLDQQIKLRGYRIELGEITNLLLGHPLVRDAITVVRDERIVAYVVGSGADDASSTLSRFVASRLPEPMVPSAFVWLDALPLTPNGKIDRRALPTPDAKRVARGRAPKGAIEVALAKLFEEILGLEVVTAEDDFFELGGHSLSATQLVSRIRAGMGRNLPLAALFAARTVAGLAPLLERADAPAPLSRAPRGGPAPLSFSQDRLRFLDRLEPNSAFYNMASAYRLIGSVDVPALSRALDALVERHEALRTTIDEAGQHVGPRTTGALVIEAEPLDERALALRIERETQTPFDLAKGPLFRLTLVRAGQEHVLLVTIHHIIGDGSSNTLLVRDLAALYAGASLPPLPLQYADFSTWQRAQEWPGLAYWKEQLGGAPVSLELPFDRPRPLVQTFRGAQLLVLVSADEANALARLGSAQGATLFMVLLATFAHLLGRHTEAREIVVGTPVANRTRLELESIVGFFVNNLALRIPTESDFFVLLDRVKATTVGALAHQDVPFEKVVEAVNPPRRTSHSPLFQVMFSVSVTPDAFPRIGGAVLEPIPIPITNAKYDLSLDVQTSPDGLRAAFEYNTDLFDEETIAAIAARWKGLVTDLAEGDRPRVTTEPERGQLLDWSRGPAPSSTSRGLVERVSEHARTTPEALAVRCGDRSLSYAALQALVDDLAGALLEAGVSLGGPVALSTEPRVEAIAAILAIWRVGAHYVPVDPELPRARIELLTAGVRFGFAESAWSDLVRPIAFAAKGRRGAARALHPDLPAYVLYTSGSTGTPKGVVVRHGALANLAEATRHLYGDARLVVMTSALHFDASVEQVVRLAEGRSILMLDRDQRRDLRDVDLAGVGALDTSPVQLRALLDRDRPLPPRVTVGNEAIDDGLWTRARGRARATGSELHNVYGPTETTVDATTALLSSSLTPTAGRPIAGVTTHVFDARFELAPPGVVGELFIGGAQLAQGYLDDAASTAERFLPDPSGDGTRIYRTGDRARWNRAAQLELLGRLDHQVKVRGFRIELGEIEATVRSREGVADAVVVVQEPARIVAFVVFEAGAARSLRAELGRLLPPHMVPALVEVEAFPLLSSGKVDRHALAARGIETDRGYVEPTSPLEAAMAEVWARVLRVDRVGMDDDFFELGGHSILALSMLDELEKSVGKGLRVADVFAHPTLSALAGVLALRRNTAIAVAPRGVPLPLSLEQTRLWFFDQLDGDHRFGVVRGVVRAHGPLDVDALARAMEAVVARHEILRTRFVVVDGMPMQEPTSASLVVGRHEFGTEEAARGHADELHAQPFDLTTAPLVRASIAKISSSEHLVAIAMHHLVSDGWSLKLFVDEVARLYEAFCRNETSPLPALAIQFADYAVAQAAARAEDRAYWEKELGGGFVNPELPADRPRTSAVARTAAKLPIAFDHELVERARRFARAQGGTLFTVVLAALDYALFLHTGERDFVVGGVLMNRSSPELAPLVGYFTSTVVYRTPISARASFRALHTSVAKTVRGANAHPEVPFETLARGSSAIQSLNVLVNFSYAEMAPVLRIGDVTLEPVLEGGRVEEGHTTVVELMLDLAESESELQGSLVYAADLFSPATIDRFSRSVRAILTEGLDAPEQPLSRVDVLSEIDRTTLLDTWNATARKIERTNLRDALRAGKDPNAIAVCFGETSLSYAALFTRVDALAAALQSAEVDVESRVAVSLPPSIDMLVSVLACLTIGAAYVPLDPSYPPDRLAYMLEDSGARVLLANEAPTFAVPAAVVTLAPNGHTSHERTPRTVSLSPDHLAYVLYTSGSTGKPKGVEISHGAVLNLLRAFETKLSVGTDDVLCAVTSLSFDIAGLELYLPLLCGARLVILSREDVIDASVLVRRFEEHGATIVQATPVTWKGLVEVGFRSSRITALCGGEALPMTLARELAARTKRTWNVYGPTETTIWSAAQPIVSSDVTLGPALDNTTFYVLNDELAPTPIGVPGELFIGGAGVARGYHDRPELTAERFVPCPWEAGARMYRTGDLVRYRPDGRLEYLSRLDHQVKLRGHRIELGEIEAALVSHPQITDAVALVRENGLIAFVVASAVPSDLSDMLARSLPAYMVPSVVVALPRLPLTPNGKIDRKALPSSVARSPAAPRPRTPEETRIAEVWADVLEVETVAVDEDFFGLGGHSLLATRMLARVGAAFGIELPIGTIFSIEPTVRALAALVVERLTTRAPSIPPAVVKPRETAATPATLAAMIEELDDLSEEEALAELERLSREDD